MLLNSVVNSQSLLFLLYRLTYSLPPNPHSLIHFFSLASRTPPSLAFPAASLDTLSQFTLLIPPLHLNLLLLELPRVTHSWFPFSICTQHLTSLSFKYQLFYAQMTPQYMSAAQKPSSPTPHSYSIQMPANTSLYMSDRHFKFHTSEIMPYLPPPSHSSPLQSMAIPSFHGSSQRLCRHP